jgi:DNA-binding IclR family transcriptional regulator
VRAAAHSLTSPAGELIAAVSVATRTEEIPRIDFLQRILPAFLGTAHAIAQASPPSHDDALDDARL